MSQGSLESEQKAAREEFDALSKTLEEFTRYEYEVKAVQWREKADKAGAEIRSRDDHIAKDSITNTGYKCLLDAYEHTTDLSLVKSNTRDDRSDVKKMTQVLDDLTARDYSILSYSDVITKYPDSLLKKLDQDGEVFMTTSIPQHHALAKYSKDPKDGKYYKTIYNAGYDVKKAGKENPNIQADIALNIVYGIAKYPINSTNPEDIKSLITEDFTVKYGLTTSKHNPLLGDPILQESTITSQQRSNVCTTRSTREMLRDNLPVEHFRNMYDMVTGVSYDEIKGSLEAKRQELASQLGVTLDNKKSIAHESTIQKHFENILKNALNGELGLPEDSQIADISNITRRLTSSEPLRVLANNVQAIEFALQKYAKGLVESKLITANSNGVSIESQYNFDPISLATFIAYYNETHTEGSREMMLQKASSAASSDLIEVAKKINGEYWHIGKLAAMNFSRTIPGDEKAMTVEIKDIIDRALGNDVLITNESINPVLESFGRVISYGFKGAIESNTLPSSYLKSNKEQIVEDLKQAIIRNDEVEPEIRDSIVKTMYSANQKGDASRQHSDDSLIGSSPRSRSSSVSSGYESPSPTPNDYSAELDFLRDRQNLPIKRFIEYVLQEVGGGDDIAKAPNSLFNYIAKNIITPMMQQDQESREKSLFMLKNDEGREAAKLYFAGMIQEAIASGEVNLNDSIKDEARGVGDGVKQFIPTDRQSSPKVTMADVLAELKAKVPPVDGGKVEHHNTEAKTPHIR